MRTRSIAPGLASLLVFSACVRAETGTQGMAFGGTAARNSVIEKALVQEDGMLSIPTGPMRLSGRELAFLKSIESLGFVTLAEIPQAYWDSFLNNTQGLGAPIVVTETQKFLELIGAPPLPPVAPGAPPRGVVTHHVKISDDKIEKVITDEEYTGQLSTPGEKYRIVLGSYRNIPTQRGKAFAALGMPQEETRLKFRCVVKNDQFKNEWKVVALDVAAIDADQWRSANVK